MPVAAISVVQRKVTARRMCAPLSGVTSGIVALLPFGRAPGPYAISGKSRSVFAGTGPGGAVTREAAPNLAFIEQESRRLLVEGHTQTAGRATKNSTS